MRGTTGDPEGGNVTYDDDKPSGGTKYDRPVRSDTLILFDFPAGDSVYGKPDV